MFVIWCMHTEINKKLLITGGNGYIAKSCISHFKSKYEIDVVSRQNFNLTNTEEVVNFFKNKHYDAVLHTAITGGSRLFPDAKENVYSNLLMFENLLLCNNSFDKLINFGSGAEIWAPETPYGLSKKIINKLVSHTSNTYNLRIYGVFDQNELSTRFIKTCIQSCKDGTSINIHQNKLFDFFYMKDLMALIEYYILSQNPPKLIECCYPDKTTLHNVAEYICTIAGKDPKNNINIIDSNIGAPYTGTSNLPKLSYIGLAEGIRNTVAALCVE